MGSVKQPSYTAFEEKNGLHTILDVPIFSEVPKGEKNAPEDIGRAWLEKAIDAAATLEKQNAYLPPLHIGHHKPGETVEGAGHFRLRRIRAMQFDGTERSVLTADLVGLSKETFDDIMLGKYPYRSVEISDWSEARINHLALLSHQEPFFKFPLLNGSTIRLEKTAAKAMQRAECEGKRAVAFFSEGEPEETVANPKTEKRPTREELAARIQKLLPTFEKGGEEEGAEFTEEEAEEALGAALAELDEIESGKKKPTEEEFDALCERLEALADLFDGGEEEEESEEEEEGPDDDPRPAELSKAQKKQAAKLAALEDKVEFMDATAANEKTVAKRVAKAKAELAGYNLTPKMLSRIEKFAREDESGELLDEYVANHKEIGAKEPVALMAEQAATDPALKGLNLSPDASERAIQLSADYEIAKKRGFTTVDKKTFIALNLEAEAASVQ